MCLWRNWIDYEGTKWERTVLASKYSPPLIATGVNFSYWKIKMVSVTTGTVNTRNNLRFFKSWCWQHIPFQLASGVLVIPLSIQVFANASWDALADYSCTWTPCHSCDRTRYSLVFSHLADTSVWEVTLQMEDLTSNPSVTNSALWRKKIFQTFPHFTFPSYAWKLCSFQQMYIHHEGYTTSKYTRSFIGMSQ